MEEYAGAQRAEAGSPGEIAHRAHCRRRAARRRRRGGTLASVVTTRENGAGAVVRPSWLTSVLHAAGTLPEGKVRRLHPRGRQRTAGGSLARFEVDYTKDVPDDVPRRVLVKVPRTDRPADLLDTMGRKEVTFYRDVAPLLPGVPVPRCLAAECAGTGQWHVVLEDLSETHTQTQWPVPPTDDVCAAAIDALAALHAALWGDPRLERDLGSVPTAQEIAANIRRATELAARFVEFLGDRLSPARRRCYEQTVGGLPRLWMWWLSREARTLVHGDAHAWNLLFPRTTPGDEASSARVFLIDWQNWQVGPPMFDLATFIVLDWYPERRARLERALLRRYHDRLCAHGVRSYDWDACWRDYRLATANTLFTCAWRWDNGTEAQYWWPHLETALAAFADLDCQAVLGR